jgi:outer membrane protein OmpA-like peptidoglycan-associated protein
MLKKTFLFLPALLLLCSLAFAQNDSKSKSSEKLYERGDKNKNVKVKNATNINTERLDFSPQYYQNGIVWVSSSKNGNVDSTTNEPYFELFYAEVDKNGDPQKREPFSLQLNSQKHEGPVSFSRDFKTIYFNRNNIKNEGTKKKQVKKNPMQIFEAERGYFDWEKIKYLPFNNPDFQFLHPALSPEGTELYFASNMPGGAGKMDIWKVKRTESGWSEPENLGPGVNSAGNEGFPFVHESKVLFFSSDGRDSTQNFDIYGYNLMGGAAAYSLEAPFNSSGDDLGFILDKNGTKGFFASDREGGYGRDDIYSFEAPEGIEGIDVEVPMEVIIVVADSATQEPLEGALVRIFEQSEDGFLEGDNLYDVNLVPNPASPNELVLKLIRKDVDAMDENTPSQKTLSNGEVYAEMMASKKYIILASKKDYEDGEMLYSPVELGEDGKIMMYLKKPACVTLKGNITVDGSDQMLEDVNVTIVNNCDNTAQQVKADQNGQFIFCIPPDCDFSISAEKDGYETAVSEFSTEDMKPGSELTANIKMSDAMPGMESGSEAADPDGFDGPMEEGAVIILQNIYYDFGKSVIRAGAARELDALSTLMRKYPSMEIELISHTDSRGSDEFNQQLSLARAESAKEYLMRNGVEANRVTAFGYGESQLRNDCADGVECDEEDHAFNRRTEVRITKIDVPIKVEYRVKKP